MIVFNRKNDWFRLFLSFFKVSHMVFVQVYSMPFDFMDLEGHRFTSP